MPFEQLNDLPASVQGVLPKHAQEIYRAAFNSAWQQYNPPEERRAGRTREPRTQSRGAPSSKLMRKTSALLSGLKNASFIRLSGITWGGAIDDV